MNVIRQLLETVYVCCLTMLFHEIYIIKLVFLFLYSIYHRNMSINDFKSYLLNALIQNTKLKCYRLKNYLKSIWFVSSDCD